MGLLGVGVSGCTCFVEGQGFSLRANIDDMTVLECIMHTILIRSKYAMQKTCSDRPSAVP